MSLLEIGPTMDTQEYLKRKEQEELDKFFDNIQTNKNMETVTDLHSDEEFAKLISKLNDIESELNISAELYIKKSKDINSETKEIKDIKKYITYLKTQQTLINKKIDKFIKED